MPDVFTYGNLYPAMALQVGCDPEGQHWTMAGEKSIFPKSLEIKWNQRVSPLQAGHHSLAKTVIDLENSSPSNFEDTTLDMSLECPGVRLLLAL